MNRFQRILCVIDPGQPYAPVLERTVKLAKENQASVTVVATIETVTAIPGIQEGGPITTNLQTRMVHAYAQRLEAAVAPHRKQVEIQTWVLVGTPFLEIIRKVLHDGHDLVIKIPETLDWLEQSFGSNDLHLLRKCPCPVWLIRPRGVRSYRRILAAVDVGCGHPQAELETRHP